jgi:hypothetical protein
MAQQATPVQTPKNQTMAQQATPVQTPKNQTMAQQATPQQATPQQATPQASPQQTTKQDKLNATQATPQQTPKQDKLNATQTTPQQTPKQDKLNASQATPQQTPKQNATPQETPKPKTFSPPKQELVQVSKENPKEEEVPSYPSPNKLMKFLEMRNFIRDHYIEFTWPKVQLENLCVPKGGTDLVKFTATQDLIRNIFTPSSSYKGMLLWHSVGTGKCHAKDTPILMYDGSIKLVQDVQIGDQIMGDDSTPRTVLALGRGQDHLYEVDQEFGDSYTVNSEHILCLKDIRDNVHEIEIQDYVRLPQEDRQQLKGYKVPIEFSGSSIVFDAYDIGTEFPNRKIPSHYKLNNRNIRLQVLAGIIDTVGEYSKNEYVLKSTSPDIVFVARSLGFGAEIINSRIHIFGKHLDLIPVRNPNNKASPFARQQDALVYAIDVNYKGFGDYYGFTLDGNNRYVMGDFTVTHNTCCAIATATSSFEKEGYTILWVTRTTLKSDIWKNMFDQVCSLVIKERILAGQNIPIDFAQRMRLLSKSWKIKPISYKQFSNLVSGKNQLYKDLVAINGAQDPLRRTLLIIDEAHKLYGGSDLSAIERPDMSKLHHAIMRSYGLSGKDSVKVLLMTATPITNDPMELIKLINLCREEQLPTVYKAFAERYLNEYGQFTKKGMRSYLDDIAGTISYLSREKDARQFSQPTIIPVNVPLQESQFGSVQLEKLKDQIDEATEKNNTDIAYLKTKISDVKQERMRIKKELKARCTGIPKAQRIPCLQEIEHEIGYREKEFETRLNDYSQDINKLTTDNKEMKKELQLKKKLAKEDASQQAILETKCMKKKKS